MGKRCMMERRPTFFGESAGEEAERRPGGSMMEERFPGKVALKRVFGESSEPGFCKNGD